MSALIEHSLNGAWQFHEVGDATWLPANVPGGVHSDLLAAGRIADPFVGDEEKRVQWVAERDWEYRRVFEVPSDLLNAEHVFIRCEGLDTLAEVRLNGTLLGSTDNMFRSYRWEVKRLLRAGQNEVRVLFRSPVQYVAERQRQRPMVDVNDVIHGAPYLRNTPRHFGWDWGPKHHASGN